MSLGNVYKFCGAQPIDFVVEFRTSSPDDFSHRYNIILNDDGSVYDLDLKCAFTCVYNWANNLGAYAHV